MEDSVALDKLPSEIVNTAAVFIGSAQQSVYLAYLVDPKGTAEILITCH